MIVALTIMKVIYDREKLKQAAQRALSVSWQSARNFSVSSKNLMSNVSRHSSVFNRSRHGRRSGSCGGSVGSNDRTGGRNSGGGGSRKDPMGLTAKDWKELNALVDEE